MTKRALLPGEQEAWERACAERRWVVRAASGKWYQALTGRWEDNPFGAVLTRRAAAAGSIVYSTDTIAYRARSVRADGTPVVP